MFERIPPGKRVAAMIGLALLVALSCLGIGLYAVCRADADRHQVAQLTDLNRNRQEKIDRLDGRLLRLQKSFDDALSQLKSRDELLARAGEVQQQIAGRQAGLLREQRSRQALLQGVKEKIDGQLGSGNGTVFLSGNSLTVRLSDKLLYGSGRSDLSDDGRAVLRKIADLLNTTLRDFDAVVEGHTDNLPIARALQYKYPTNWELSAARASGAVAFLIGQGRVGSGRLAAVGRGDTGAVADNDSESGRAANRRIDIIVKLNREQSGRPLAAPAAGGGD
jgi:chemotaxis protein MotB